MITFTKEQRIVVTGASSGLGKAVALLLNELGASIIISGRHAETLDTVRAECTNPEHCQIETRDLGVNLESLPIWIQELRVKYGKLHGLAYCAGQTWMAPMQNYDLQDAHRIFDICCHAPLLAARGFVDRRNNSGKGSSVVFIAASSSVEPNKGQGIYAAAKAALVIGARCLSKELAPQRIRINCVSPGLVKTPMMDETVKLLGVEFLQNESHLYPLGFGEPEDVAATVAFLLSERARWITGSNVLLTGGRY